MKRVFNHSSVSHKPLEFEQFYKGILKAGAEVNDNKIKELKKRLKMLPSNTIKKAEKQKPKVKSVVDEEGEGESDEEGEESER